MTNGESERMILPGHDRQHFYDTLMKVTHGMSDETLASILIDNSRSTMAWLRSNGVRFVPMYGRQSYEVGGKQHIYGGVNIEAVGGGAGPLTRHSQMQNKREMECADLIHQSGYVTRRAKRTAREFG